MEGWIQDFKGGGGGGGGGGVYKYIYIFQIIIGYIITHMQYVSNTAIFITILYI